LEKPCKFASDSFLFSDSEINCHNLAIRRFIADAQLSGLDGSEYRTSFILTGFSAERFGTRTGTGETFFIFNGFSARRFGTRTGTGTFFILTGFSARRFVIRKEI
jgi:hypothetical protein